MTVTTIPVGNTGQFLEGWEVNGAVRESVSLTDPTNQDGVAEIVSTQPIAAYGLPVWVQGTPNVGISGTVPITGTASTQIVSSVPFYVAQSSSPWTMNGGIAVTNVPTVNVTNVPAVQITTSIPFFVAQSSGPWNVSVTAHPDIRGGVAVTNSPNVNVTNVPTVNITSSVPFYVAQSSSPWTVNVSTMPGLGGTTMVNVVSTVAQTINVTVSANNITSSIPFFVAQSSGPWAMANHASTAGGGNVTTVVCLANLNTTVIKAGRGQLYSVHVSYFGSSNAYVKFGNASTAAHVSTTPARFLLGVMSSTSVFHAFPAGTEFDTGIVMYTIRTPFAAANSHSTGILGSSMTVSVCYE